MKADILFQKRVCLNWCSTTYSRLDGGWWAENATGMSNFIVRLTSLKNLSFGFSWSNFIHYCIDFCFVVYFSSNNFCMWSRVKQYFQFSPLLKELTLANGKIQRRYKIFSRINERHTDLWCFRMQYLLDTTTKAFTEYCQIC